MEVSASFAVTALGVLIGVLVYVARTPKEVRMESEARNKEAHAEHRRRMDLIETNHDVLSLRFADSFGRLDTAVNTLSKVVERLNERESRRPR